MTIYNKKKYFLMNKNKNVYIEDYGACIIKLITAVIYSFCNKLECSSLASFSS
jgi:hypothetical protein